MTTSRLSQQLLEMYSEQPTKPLYHYTSISGVTGIVTSKALYATDIQYFNDAAEMKYTADLIRNELATRIHADAFKQRLFEQFRDWTSHRLTDSHMQFVVCFTGTGNILSQWRGYCPKGKGVSLGFNQRALKEAATAQSFSMGRCRYNIVEQKEIVKIVVDTVEYLADKIGENTDTSKRHPSNSFHDVFETIESDLLKTAALLKHPAFSEEEEWRAVSPIVSNYNELEISYREGQSMLLPYILFRLPQTNSGTLSLMHAFLGPTPNANHSMRSLAEYLSKCGSSPTHSLRNCDIPYRDW